MNCPKHYTALNRSVVDDREVGCCPDCDGVWIPGKSIDALLGDGERLKLRSLCSARESDLICPHDFKQLGEATIAGVTIALCPSCNGLWLDRDELERLQARPRMRQTAIAGSLRAEPERNSTAPLEVVSEGLLALLMSI